MKPMHTGYFVWIVVLIICLFGLPFMAHAFVTPDDHEKIIHVNMDTRTLYAIEHDKTIHTAPLSFIQTYDASGTPVRFWIKTCTPHSPDNTVQPCIQYGDMDIAYTVISRQQNRINYDDTSEYRDFVEQQRRQMFLSPEDTAWIHAWTGQGKTAIVVLYE